MASRKPPKKEEKGKGMLMKEALDARVTELSTSPTGDDGRWGDVGPREQCK